MESDSISISMTLPQKQAEGTTHLSSDSSTLAAQISQRREKLQQIQKEHYDPYAQHFSPSHSVWELIGDAPESPDAKTQYSIAGRIRTQRKMGKVSFANLEDHSGTIQIYLSKGSLQAEYALAQSLDLGDIIGASGFLFYTRTQQLTLHVQQFKLLAKCLRPLPITKEADGKRFDTFSDKEQRYRLRYVDLIVNPEVRQHFETRAKILRLIRNFLEAADFIEVETPVMQSLAGGASARPFITYHNTLDMQLYLRVAPELYLKRLIVGGFPKVFEIGRNFRNEGISPKHNPEFSMLEIYQAYANLEDMMKLCTQMINHCVEAVLGTKKLRYGKHQIEFLDTWREISYIDAIQEHLQSKVSLEMPAAEARDLAKASVKQSSIPMTFKEIELCQNTIDVLELLFDKHVEPRLIEPTLITCYPKAISPLAKESAQNAKFVDRFEPYIMGRELGNAFSELNDPIEQKKRFETQVAEQKRTQDASKPSEVDTDYIRALEYGMPPTGGLGIGIDRLAMLLLNVHSIRDSILFPLLRPETPQGHAHSKNKDPE